MYNEINKMNYAKENSSLEEIDLFKITEPFEQKLNKDISRFNLPEIINLFNELKLTKHEVIKAITTLKEYNDFAIMNCLTDSNVNSMRGLSLQNALRLMNENK